MDTKEDSYGAIAEALFMINLLLVGLFYIALWLLYLFKYKEASSVSKNHIKQALVASTISMIIFVLMNIYVLMTSGFASATTLILAEVYLMLVIPLFLIVGILGFTKAINHKDYAFPIIGKMLDIKTDNSKI